MTVSALTAQPPRVEVAHVGGSGTWAFPYPDGALDDHPYLSVRVIDADIRVATPFGPSPSFRRCRLTDRRSGRERDYLYVWMHGLEPAGRADAPGASALASERVFDVLARAGVRSVLVDNSTGAVAEDLSPWDLVVVKEVVDLSGAVPRPVAPGLVRFRDPLCPRLAGAVGAAVATHSGRYADLAGAPGATPRVKTDGIYVHTPGPWFETPIENRVYRRLGFDVVGKTAGPEFRLARMRGMCLGILSVVVNPAEGLGKFEREDLRAIYRRCGPTVARMVIEAIAGAVPGPDGETPCHCADTGGASLFQEFSPFARYRAGKGDPVDA